MITTKRNIVADFKENGIDKSYDEVFSLICKNIKVTLSEKSFVYFIDTEYVMDTTKGYRYENLTPAYEKVLTNGLEQLKYQQENTKFKKNYNNVLDNLMFLVDRIINELSMCGDGVENKIKWFTNLKTKPAEGFEEALQRMLFVNQMFWQTDHRLTGLGAWDTILAPYYEADVKSGKITKEDAYRTVREAFLILHDYYEFKSNVLMGDTGQIFVLGKSDLDGNYIHNDLTYYFIEAMKELQLPEPKCLLRVNKQTPRVLIELALDTISTGIGAPLLANDDVIIPKLIEFGIDDKDACDYTTSACWEPLIGGKSSSLNNMTVLNYMKAFDNLLKREDLSELHTFEELLECYLVYLRRNLNAVKRVLEPHRFQYNPLLSVFLDDCFENETDVSHGGARYHHVGITSVAMGNLINALMNIKTLVFEEHKYTLYDVKRMIILNFENDEEVRKELIKRSSHYGTDDEEIIKLVNRITKCVSEEIEGYRSYLGGKMKIGLSGSAYMDAARNFGASFDGRKAGEAFITHISNEDNNGFTEIINFASQMNYDKSRFNGNVVDLMVSPDFISNNKEKFVDFLQASIYRGFFEMQMNVVSSKTLIEARKNPEKFPNLVVRVWGFSSYFKDLPDEYKDVLIERAIKNER